MTKSALRARRCAQGRECQYNRGHSFQAPPNVTHISATDPSVDTPVNGEALLNSDLIRERFGSYHLDVLRRGDDTRVSSLSSGEDGKRVCRTFAVTQFLPGRLQVDAQVLRKIDDGGSIGATLRRAGLEVDKQTLVISDVSLDDAVHPALERMQLQAPATLALHIYTLGIRSDSDASPFAIIAELHHPHFLSSSQLFELFELSTEPARMAVDLDALRAEIFQIGT